jgi:hypothetical protein
VADIKLSTPRPPNVRLQPGGRIDLQGITMKLMIQVAWDINDDELIAAGRSGSIRRSTAWSRGRQPL